MTIEQAVEKLEAAIRDARYEGRDNQRRLEDGVTKWQAVQDERLLDHDRQLAGIHVKTGVTSAFFGMLGAAVAAIALWFSRLGGK